MNEDLPAALLRLREGDIVRICGLARAARGLDYLHTGKVRQAERLGGTVRATVLADERAWKVLAHFSERGLDAWECSCTRPGPMQADAPNQTTRQPCEHVAALLHAWARDPTRFHPPSPTPSSVPGKSYPPAVAGGMPELPQTGEQVGVGPALAPVQAAPSAAPTPSSQPLLPPVPARLQRLDPVAWRCLRALALAEGGVTESVALRLFSRLGLAGLEEAQRLLSQLHQQGLVQRVLVGGHLRRSTGQVSQSADLVGWRLSTEALAVIPRVVPLHRLLASLQARQTDAQQEAPEMALPEVDQEQLAAPEEAEELPPEAELRELPAAMRLPETLFLLAALVADRTAPAPDTVADSTVGPRAAAALAHEQAQRWAEQLSLVPEQVQFYCSLLRLLGLIPTKAVRPKPGEERAPAGNLGNRQEQRKTLALSHEQAAEALLRAYRLLLGRSPTEVMADVFTHWVHARSARELLELRAAGIRVAWQGQRASRQPPDIAGENQAARQAVVDLLRQVPAGRWWSFRSLVDFLWAFRPDFLRGHQQTLLRPQWWLERLEDGEELALDIRSEWGQGEGRYVALLFRRALHWLGIVDLALDERGRLKGFRITPAGAWVLGAAASPEAIPQEHLMGTRLMPGEATRFGGQGEAVLRVLEDSRLLVSPGELDEQRLKELLCWCEPAGAVAEGLAFLPAARCVAEALDAGNDLDAWLAWLEKHMQGTADAPVAQFRHWAQRYGQVRLYESVPLLEVAEPALMRELDAAVDLSTQFVEQALAPHLAVVRADAVEPLLEALRRRGYEPWVITDETLDRS